MARPRIDSHWTRQIETYAAEGYGPKAIERMLAEEAKERGRDDCPSERTIGRTIKDWKQRPETERRDEALFRWPDAMEKGDLPWEAGAAGIELLRAWEVHRMPRRPTVRQVRWYHRVKQSAPDLRSAVAVALAFALAMKEHTERIGAPAMDIIDLDRRLAFASETNPMEDGEAAAYEAARKRVLADKTGMTLASLEDPTFVQRARELTRVMMPTLLDLQQTGLSDEGLRAAADLLVMAADPRTRDQVRAAWESHSKLR